MDRVMLSTVKERFPDLTDSVITEERNLPMKIVSLLGSPRTQGNSATIANRFTETAAKLGAETMTYELNRLAYQGCQGCYACKRGLEECVIEDDLTQVLAAVREADCVVLASAVYFGQITAQLKGFVDRSQKFYGVPRIILVNGERHLLTIQNFPYLPQQIILLERLTDKLRILFKHPLLLHDIRRIAAYEHCFDTRI